MAVFDLDARITEEDLSGINRRTRQPIFLYVEAESTAKTVQLEQALTEFLEGIMQDPTLKTSADVEIAVFDGQTCLTVKECGGVENATVASLSELHPTDGQGLALAPILQQALERIAAQKRTYQTNRISYGKPALLLFTAGNLTDTAEQLQDVAARTLREASVDILPVCQEAEHPLLKAISSKGVVLQMPIEQAYTQVFLEIRNSMERLSKSTAATYQELATYLVDGAQYFQ